MEKGGLTSHVPENIVLEHRFGPKWSHRRQKCSPKRGQRLPKGTQRESKGSPKAKKGSPDHLMLPGDVSNASQNRCPKKAEKCIFRATYFGPMLEVSSITNPWKTSMWKSRPKRTWTLMKIRRENGRFLIARNDVWRYTLRLFHTFALFEKNRKIDAKRESPKSCFLMKMIPRAPKVRFILPF